MTTFHANVRIVYGIKRCGAGYNGSLWFCDLRNISGFDKKLSNNIIKVVSHESEKYSDTKPTIRGLEQM